MKAIRVHAFGEPSVLQLEDVPDPTPAAGQVVVKLHAVGVNPVETYVRKGIYGPKPFPYTPGTDGAGVVDAVGPGVTRCKRRRPGVRRRVASPARTPSRPSAPRRRVHPLPADVSFEQGAALGVPYATAYRALVRRGKAGPGETVLVHGATGGVGAGRRPDRQGPGPDRPRHRRHRPRPRARPPGGGRTTSSTTPTPATTRSPRPHRRQGRRPHPGDAGEREPRART